MSSSPAQTDERATGRDSLDGIKTRRPDGSGGAASGSLAEPPLAQPPSMAASRLVGLRVSPIGLGMAALGRPGYINLGHGRDLGVDHSPQAIRRHAETVLDAAWAAGIRYFDAARSYGLAEDFLGGWLSARGIEASRVTVGSKWGYVYTADWRIDADVHEVKDHSLQNLHRQWQESTALLGSRLRLYQIHSATADSRVLEDAGVLAELARLKAAGIAIGLTTSGPGQSAVIARATELRLDGVRLFDVVQATWNLLERSSASALAAAHGEGIGVIVKEAMANGRLTGGDGASIAAVDASRLLRQSDRLAATADALALAAVLARPWVDVALSGVASVGHLRSNLAALRIAWDDEAEADLAPLAEEPDQYWRTRAQLAWN